MKKKYLVREIVEEEVELTEEEVRQIYETRGKEVTKLEILDEVDQYMEQMNVVWRREDLEVELSNEGIEPTERNIRIFMENNPELDYDVSYGWEELSRRIRAGGLEKFLIVKKYKVKNPDFLIEVREMYEDGEVLYDDGDMQYEILIDGELYSNYIDEEEMKSTVAALLFKRDYKEVEI